MYKLLYENKLNPDLYLFYLLWPIIIFQKEIQFIIIFFILLSLLNRHKLFFDKLSYFIFTFIIIYLFSIIYNIIDHSYELPRIIATINTFSIWIFALVFYLIYRSISVDINAIKKITFINYCILIVLWVCSVSIYYVTNSQNISLVKRYLYYTEWFSNKEVIRFVGFMEYSNLVIMFFMFFYPIYISYALRFKSKILRVFFVIIGLLPIITTFSRSGYLIIVSYLLVVGVYYLYKKNQKMFISLSFFALALALPIGVYTSFSSNIMVMLQDLINAREGSNSSRNYLFLESIKVTLNNSPLIGMGVKDSSSIGYPLGSHSTFIGFFYKTGIIGLIAGTIIFVLINFKMLFIKSISDMVILKISLFIMLPILFVEDIDGSNWLIIVYFLLVGLIFNNKKQEKSELPI